MSTNDQTASLSSVFKIDGPVTAKSTGTLSTIFTDATQKKFARSVKPEEFKVQVKKKKEKSKIEPVLLTAAERRKQEKKKKRYANRQEQKRQQLACQSNEAAIESNTKISEQPSGVVNNHSEVRKPVDSEHTLFVGNISIKATVKTVTKLFEKYGKVESVRFRSVPISGVKVDEAGNQDLVRKVCANSKKFGDQKGSLNAYVNFSTKAAAEEALTLDNTLWNERHLRVDWATLSSSSAFPAARSVFLGGLPHYADEEELREFFAKAMPNGGDDIHGLRIIRDANTLIGKGIGYLLLSDRDAMLAALALHQTVYKKRWPLRVTTCGKRTVRSVKSTDSSSRKRQQDDSDSGNSSGREPSKSVEPSRKRRRKDSKSAPPAAGAMRRIKSKVKNTRNKVLKERGQKKAKKQIGGVMKRAMKVAKQQSGKKTK